MKNKNIGFSIIALVFIFVIVHLAGCTGGENQPNSSSSSTESTKSAADERQQENSDLERTADEGNNNSFNAYTLNLHEAVNFKVEYLSDGMKLLTDGRGRGTLLLQEGQSAPVEYADIPALTIPLKDAIFTSTTQVGYLRAFDDDRLFDSIAGVRAGLDAWDFDSMRSRMMDGRIVDIGSNTQAATNHDYEIIRELNPSVIFTNTGISSEQVELMAMCDEVGIHYIFDGSGEEKDYAAMIEWVKFYAVFYNLEDEASAFYDEAIKRIENVTSIAASIDESDKIVAGWGIVTAGKVYVATAGSKTAQMIRDCGGIYAFDDLGPDADSTVEISVEEFFSVMSNADVFIDRGMPKYGPDIDNILAQIPVLGEIDAMSEGNILQITDFYWSSYHNFDGKYVEMAEFFYPDLCGDITVDEFIHFRIMPQSAE